MNPSRSTGFIRIYCSSHRLYSKHLEAWCEFTLLPAAVPSCVAFAFTKIEDSEPKLLALAKASSLASQSAMLAQTLNRPEDHDSEINFSLVEVASRITCMSATWRACALTGSCMT